MYLCLEVIVIERDILSPRENIPEGIKRQVRQKDGFGCCKCGNPIVQYHHIVPRSENPEEIMLLCPLHHDEATSKAMTFEEQLYWKQNPVNITSGRVVGILKINQSRPIISIGSVQFIGDSDIILVDDESLLSVNMDSSASYDNFERLTISARLYDSHDKLLAVIENNEWILGDPKPWDIIAKWQYLKISSGTGDIAIEINAKSDPITIKGNLWRKKQHILLSNCVFFISGVINNSSICELCLVGMRIVMDTILNQCRIEPNPKIGKAVLVSESNRKKRIRKGLKAWKELNKKF